MSTSRAVIPTFNRALGFDVASTYFTPIWTRFLIAPLSLSFHRASPRLGRCAKHNSKTGFPGLEAQHRRLELHDTAKSVMQHWKCYFASDPSCYFAFDYHQKWARTTLAWNTQRNLGRDSACG